MELQKEIELWTNIQGYYIPEEEEETEEEKHENEPKIEKQIFTKVQTSMRKTPSTKCFHPTRPGFEGIPVIIKKRNIEIQCF